jgi:hypothetical protein
MRAAAKARVILGGMLGPIELTPGEAKGELWATYQWNPAALTRLIAGVLSGTWVTFHSGHIGDTLPAFGGTPNAVAGVLQDGRAAAVRGSVAGRGENGGAVPELDITAPT